MSRAALRQMFSSDVKKQNPSYSTKWNSVIINHFSSTSVSTQHLGFHQGWTGNPSADSHTTPSVSSRWRDHWQLATVVNTSLVDDHYWTVSGQYRATAAWVERNGISHPDNVTYRWFLPADQTRRWSTTSNFPNVKCRFTFQRQLVDAVLTEKCFTFYVLICMIFVSLPEPGKNSVKFSCSQQRTHCRSRVSRWTIWILVGSAVEDWSNPALMSTTAKHIQESSATLTSLMLKFNAAYGQLHAFIELSHWNMDQTRHYSCWTNQLYYTTPFSAFLELLRK